MQDLQRLRDFLRPKSPQAARRAGQSILKGVQVLGLQPLIGRRLDDAPPHYREWLITSATAATSRATGTTKTSTP